MVIFLISLKFYYFIMINPSFYGRGQPLKIKRRERLNSVPLMELKLYMGYILFEKLLLFRQKIVQSSGKKRINFFLESKQQIARKSKTQEGLFGSSYTVCEIAENFFFVYINGVIRKKIWAQSPIFFFVQDTALFYSSTLILIPWL